MVRTGERAPPIYANWYAISVRVHRKWYAPDLAEQVVNRLLLRFGPGLVIVHGGATGIDASFAQARADPGVE
jgi:hypothetical protein